MPAARTGTAGVELRGHTNQIAAAGLSADGTRVASAGTWPDRTVRVWDAESGAELLAPPGDTFATFSTDGTRLLTRGRGGGVLVYDVRPPTRPRSKP